ncbi:multidrug permease ABC transporter [Bombiscardovia apis]|uniref:Multidrug permease ABC transporter n=1 Tax=Bombiscardovia apis TaxID=2932182 RepID=A0ABM8BB69_9BIFI|nr:ABC transporter permease [Bombiscardovia apis]BDR54160.1 multidrug permease ABC transporter [Bombiscardovia apis]
MSTCKTALRIIWAHKSYFLLYLVGMSAIMLIIGGSLMQSAVKATASSSVGQFEPARARIAIINRDQASQTGRELSQGLKSYLKKSSTVVEVADDPQALQDANVSGKSNLTVFIPEGYGQQFVDKLNDSLAAAVATTAAPPTSNPETATAQSPAFPKVEASASYNSSQGSLAQLQVDSYFDGLRTAALSSLAQETAQAPQPVDAAALKTASDYTLAHYSSNQPAIKVQATNTASSTTLAAGFASTVSLGAYPLMSALTVCIATLFCAFSSADRHRRLLASPLPTGSMNGQELLAAFILGVVAWVYMIAATLATAVQVGSSLSSLGWGPITLSFMMMLAFIAAASAFGFMLSQFNPSSTLINAVSVTFGLVIMFTSGASSSATLPPVMQTIGKLTPGWWYSAAVTAAMGVDSPGQGLSARSSTAWLPPLAIVLLFAVAYIGIGLMVSRLTRTQAKLAAPTASEPTLVG